MNLSAIINICRATKASSPVQRGFVKDRSCLANWTSYNKAAHLLDERRAVEVFYLGFNVLRTSSWRNYLGWVDALLV